MEMQPPDTWPTLVHDSRGSLMWTEKNSHGNQHLQLVIRQGND